MKTIDKSNPDLKPFSFLIGRWTVVGSHPYLPGANLQGSVTFEWFEGGAYIKMMSEIDHSEIPKGMAIIGTDSDMSQATMLYSDERNVSRSYDISVTGKHWEWSRDNPEFSQRFKVTVSDDGNTMLSKGEMRKNGGEWEPDLDLNYTRDT